MTPLSTPALREINPTLENTRGEINSATTTSLGSATGPDSPSPDTKADA